MDRKKSIDLLNHAAADELQAVHQYMYFHFHLDDQGYGPLAGLFKRTAIEEMMHIELLAERVLFLKGDVQLVAEACDFTASLPVRGHVGSLNVAQAAAIFMYEWVRRTQDETDAHARR